MYQILSAEDEIGVKPERLNMDVKEAVKESLAEKYEGIIEDDFGGVIIVITEVDEIGEGKILPGDPSVYYPAKFKFLAWTPKMHEIVEGNVVDITEWGTFLRVGPLDGLVHISQVMDDFVSYDEKNAQLAGKSSRKVLKQGDKCRARIIAISLKEQNKIGLTMRQTFLGAFNWMEAAEIEKIKEAEKAPEVKPERKIKKKKSEK